MKKASYAATFDSVHLVRTLVARRGGPISVDGVIALAACVACELELALSSNIDGPHWVNAVAAAGVTLPVAFRRPYPLVVAPLMMAFAVWQEALNGDLFENTVTPIVTLPLAIYSMGVLLDRRRALIGFGVTLALFWAFLIVAGGRGAGGPPLFPLLSRGP